MLPAEKHAERWRPHVHAERYALARLRGDGTARRELTEAHRLFVATGASGHAAHVAAALAEVPG